LIDLEFRIFYEIMYFLIFFLDDWSIKHFQPSRSTQWHGYIALIVNRSPAAKIARIYFQTWGRR